MLRFGQFYEAQSTSLVAIEGRRFVVVVTVNAEVAFAYVHRDEGRRNSGCDVKNSMSGQERWETLADSCPAMLIDHGHEAYIFSLGYNCQEEDL